MKKYKKIYVEITNVCNLQCTFCPATKRKPSFMTEGVFTQILNQIKPFTDYLYLHVKGEPLLHPGLGRFLDISHNKDFQVNITTNGTVIDKVADVLIGAPALRQINFSLHSFDDNTHEILKDKYLDSILKFIGRAMSETKIIVSLRLWNLDEALLAVDQRKRNAEIMQAIEDYFQLPYQIQSRLSAGKSFKLAERVYLNQDYEFSWPDLHQETGSSKGTCYGLRDQAAILVDGSVVPCCLDGEGMVTLGNILAEPFADIINGKEQKQSDSVFAAEKLLRSSVGNAATGNASIKGLLYIYLRIKAMNCLRTWSVNCVKVKEDTMNKIIIAVVLVCCFVAFFVLFKHFKEQDLLRERTVSAENALQAWNKQAMFIDVRTAEEYQQGHAPGSILIPLHELAYRSGEIPQDKDVFLICRSGNRSGKAVLSLVGRGYRNVYNVDGGMLSWKGPITTNN